MEERYVVLDPGHGGSDPGAIFGGIREADLVLSVAHHARDFLDHYSDPVYRVELTRETSLIDVPLAERPRKADAFVSIHVNAFHDFAANGVETLYHGDPTLAEHLQHMLVAFGWRDRGIKPDDRGQHRGLLVLRRSHALGVPAALVECGFLTNEKDRKLLQANLSYVGILLAVGIHRFFGGTVLDVRV